MKKADWPEGDRAGTRGWVRPRCTEIVAILLCFAWCLVCFRAGAATEGLPAKSDSLSPSAVVSSPEGDRLYVACAGANQVLVINSAQQKLEAQISLPGSPSGLAISKDGARVYATCGAASSVVCVVDADSGRLLKTIPAGHTALRPLLHPDGKTLFVCERFNDAIAVIDLSRGTAVARIPVLREPVSAALTRDGRFLLAANHLPQGRSDKGPVAASVSVIDVKEQKVIKELRLPNGSINLRDIRTSPDGKHACVVHNVGRFQVPVTHLARGWVNTSAMTILDLTKMEIVNTVLLDDVDRGAANPWGMDWSAEGRWVCITHAGTHEVSVIDFAGLLKKLAAVPGTPARSQDQASSHCASDVPNDLSFLQGLRRRVALKGNGPRALVVMGEKAFVPGYFSDSLDIVSLSTPKQPVESLALGQQKELTVLRRGEMYFNDATICFQGWQSCASCHDDDARVDALNWDLLNDGIGNPKDTKSLILSHKTPPAMSLGIRATANIAVRAGIQSSLSSSLPEEVPAAMEEWLKSLQPAPSPFLENGRLSNAAARGEKLFQSPEVGCATCHEPELFTDLRSYSVGTQNEFDGGASDFDTPTLRELWRTAPYLHDGSAATLREVVTSRNSKDQHGKTSHLSSKQIDDLVAYLRSL